MGFADAFVADLIRAGAPEDPDPATLRDLVAQYRTSPEARDQLILQLAFPAYNLARRFRGRNNADDLLGEAMMALVECVDRWPSVAVDDEIRTYVEYSVRRRIKDFIRDDGVLVVPGRRVREKVAKGEEVACPAVYTLDAESPDRDGDPPARRGAPADPTPTIEADCTFDLLEFFRSRDDPRDRVIVEMRIDGRPVGEIAAAVGKGRSWVFRRLRSLEEAIALTARPDAA